MQVVSPSKVTPPILKQGPLTPQDHLFYTGGRPYERINSVQHHALEHRIEDKLNSWSESMPSASFKALVAGTAVLWVPTYALVRAGATAAQFAKEPFTPGYYRGSAGGALAKIVTAPVVCVVGGAGGALGGLGYGVHRGVHMVLTSMKSTRASP